MLVVESVGPVLFVTLNRPEVRNAFNDEVISALSEVYSGLDGSVRAVVLRGNGPAFCAGGDLEWMRKAAGYSQAQNEADALKLARLFESIRLCPALTISRVHGSVFGGGCGLAAATDICVAESETKFAFSEVKLGLIPATISPFVIQKIGVGNAIGLFATGEVFSAATAQRIGLVHEVAGESELDAVVDAKLKAVLAAGPHAVAAAKRLVTEFPLSIEETARRLAEARAGDEGREGIAAFLDKRRAAFSAPWPPKV